MDGLAPETTDQSHPEASQAASQPEEGDQMDQSGSSSSGGVVQPPPGLQEPSSIDVDDEADHAQEPPSSRRRLTYKQHHGALKRSHHEIENIVNSINKHTYASAEVWKKDRVLVIEPLAVNEDPMERKVIEEHSQYATPFIEPVSYTHLTLPTIA